MVLCAALAMSGAVLAEPAQAATTGSAARTGSVAAATGGVTPLSTSCRSLRDLSPWTYLSASCTRSSLLPVKAYSAWLTCWDVGAQVSYPAFGRAYTAPWGSYGPTSTARCDSGDYATSGTIHIT
jgi:hypothetical protein